jgi:hypothetical protein
MERITNQFLQQESILLSHHNVKLPSNSLQHSDRSGVNNNLEYESSNPLSARGAPNPSSLATIQPASSSPSKIVLSDRDYKQIIKAETRRNQVELAGLYGAQINNK